MGDLISRQAVINFLDRQIKDVSETKPDKVFTKTALKAMRTTGEAVKKYVNSMPTAYDVDKVVEQLEIEAEFIKSDKDNAYGAYKLAIGIIKEGAAKDE